MGTVKEESRRKMKDLHVRLTQADYETVRRYSKISGYGSVSRFVRERLIAPGKPRKSAKQITVDTGGNGSVPEWLFLEMGRLSQQVRGVAANYNQAVTVMNSLVKNVSGRETQRLIIRRAARLDVLTHELVDTLQEMKSLVERATKEQKNEDN